LPFDDVAAERKNADVLADREAAREPVG
jgi:hypothetical protein